MARARALLAKRLGRRGITVSAGVLGALFSTHAASASVLPVVVSATIQAVTLFAAGQATALTISANAVALSEGVLKAMLISKLKIAAVLLAALCVLVLGGSALHQALASTPADPATAVRAVDAQENTQAQREQPKDGTLLKGKIGALDTQNRTVTLVITQFDRKTAEATEKEHVLTVAKNAVILQDGVATKLEDLTRGFTTTVKTDQKTAFAITVDGNTVKGQFKSMNAERNTITVIAGRDMGEKVFHLLKTTKVTTEGGKGGKVQDIQAGTEVLLTLSVLGDNTVIRIQPPPMEKKKRREP